jgi:hypothetical protein
MKGEYYIATDDNMKSHVSMCSGDHVFASLVKYGSYKRHLFQKNKKIKYGSFYFLFILFGYGIYSDRDIYKYVISLQPTMNWFHLCQKIKIEIGGVFFLCR